MDINIYPVNIEKDGETYTAYVAEVHCSAEFLDHTTMVGAFPLFAIKEHAKEFASSTNANIENLDPRGYAVKEIVPIHEAHALFTYYKDVTFIPVFKDEKSLREFYSTIHDEDTIHIEKYANEDGDEFVYALNVYEKWDEPDPKNSIGCFLCIKDEELATRLIKAKPNWACTREGEIFIFSFLLTEENKNMLDDIIKQQPREVIFKLPIFQKYEHAEEYMKELQKNAE